MSSGLRLRRDQATALRRAVLLLATALSGLAAWPIAASAHGDVDPVPAAEEPRLRAAESEALGSEHARDHALARVAARRREARLAAMTTSERARWAAVQRASSQRLVAAAQAAVADEPKSQVGEWSPRYGLPDYVMHAALMHTGEVAMWGWLPYEEPEGGGEAQRPLRGENWFWDTAKPLPGIDDDDDAAAFRRDDAPQIEIGGQSATPPLYCSGVSFLPDGRLVIAGGNLDFTKEDPESGNGWKGLDTLFIYDPESGEWSQGPTMERGRWYPTQVMLADGRTLIAGGYDETGNEAYVDDTELLSAAADALTTLDSPWLDDEETWGDVGWPGLYPHGFVMPGGKVMIVPREWSRAAALLDPESLEFEADDLDPWTARPEKEGATAVLLPPASGASNAIMQIGGFAYYRDDGDDPDAEPDIDGVAQPATRTLDHRTLGGTAPWTAQSPLQVGRSYHNTVLLPGREMVTVGGGAGNDPSTDPETSSGLYYDGNGQQSLLNAEIYDPETQTWSLGAAQQSFRAYHSVALLLPDGRVWSAGDDWHQTLLNEQTGSQWRGNAEIYSPPYLFGGLDPATGDFDPNRPAQRTEIATAPNRLEWGEQATVTTSSDDVSKMVLMAPAAVTHAIDSNQRHVALDIVARTAGKGVTVRLPGDGTTAPPGWYMLFAVNRCGTPSHAKWLRVGDAPLQAEPPAPGGPRAAAATCGPVAPEPPGPEPPAPDPPVVAPDLPPAFPPAAKPGKAWRLEVTALRASRARLLKRRQVSVAVRATRPGRLRVKATLKRRDSKPLVLGRRSVRVRRPGRMTLSIPMSLAGARALAAGAPLTLVVEAEGTADNGKRAKAVTKRRI